MAKVLVVEDDNEIAAPVVRTLQGDGHQVALAVEGISALEKILDTDPDAVVLDLGLPGMDGLEICRRVREAGKDVPILILTARSAELDLVVGLDAGADDYLVKPFKTSELLARIRALLRRSSGSLVAALHTDAIELNLSARTCLVDGNEVSLTPKEYELLELLMRNIGRVVSREQILREVWNTDWQGSTKNLDMHVSALRRKLGDAGNNIATVRGLGFRMNKDS